MSKNKKIFVILGAVALAGLVVFGYFIFSAVSTKDELVDNLDGIGFAYNSLGKSGIELKNESIKAISANAEEYGLWKSNAIARLSAGDFECDITVTPAGFKQRMVDDAHKMLDFPGGTEDGKLINKGFQFGFKDYVSGNVLPESSVLPDLQRKWSDINLLIKTLADNNASVLKDITVVKEEVKKKEPTVRRGARQNKAEETKKEYNVDKYVFKFSARPSALVGILNDLAASTRFIIIDSMSFKRERDMVAAALSDQSESTSNRNTSRRRRGSRTEETTVAEGKTGIATDPVVDGAYDVEMNISVYDFGSKEDAK